MVTWFLIKNKVQHDRGESVLAQSEVNTKSNVLHIKGVKNTLITFLVYCGVETTLGLWGASYLVGARNITAETAAGWISLYYGGITVGRLITGFITNISPPAVRINRSIWRILIN